MSSNGTYPTIILPDAAPRLRGRAAPAYPELTLPGSGYVVQVRRMAAGTMAQLRAQALKEHDGERPTPPVQRVEVAPNEWREVERTSDPDYAQAFKAWEDKVNLAASMKWVRLVQNYALLTPTDVAAVAAYREAMAAVGVELPDDDREIFVWSIVAPTAEDQATLTRFVLGISEPQPAAVEAAKASFRGDVSGEAAG